MKFASPLSIIIMFFLLTISFTSQAQTEVSAEKNTGPTNASPVNPEWKGDAELGIVNTTGNTDTTTIKSKIAATRDNKPWRHSILFESLSAEDNDTTTAERYMLGGKSDYKYSKFNYWYIGIRYEDDRFSGYDYQVTESVGYGRRLIENTDLTLDTETGPGAKQSKLETGENEDEFLWRVAGKLWWKISPHSEFTQSLSIEAGEDDTVSRSDTGLKSQIADRLAMKLSYSVKHSSDVPEGTKNTDTETIVTIVYSF